eukprot:TRINITY_DN21519_c0_g1_i1.p1 TRINITY_DN21519_c0_g1~~TRINITY_DN21519_c0_g1_i1.p1  ORF type:complete len:215 (-),score=38.79 TRINITY_DN21519_c0_g1_i1:177-821(-)
MGHTQSRTTRSLQKRDQEVQASELLHITLTAPINWKLEAHAEEAVDHLLGRVAEKLDLSLHAHCFQLVFSDTVVEDGQLTLHQIGMCQEATFQVIGLDEAKAEVLLHEEAQKVNIFIAVEGGAIDQVALVCKYCPERMHERNAHGWTLLHVAATSNLVEIATLLLEAGADPRAKSKGGRTALSLADSRQHVEMSELLGKYLAATRIHKGCRKRD